MENGKWKMKGRPSNIHMRTHAPRWGLENTSRARQWLWAMEVEVEQGGSGIRDTGQAISQSRRG
jgi:hypothetical protein